LTDAAVVDRVRSGETALFELLMRRHNERLYRAARAILRDDGEAEDVIQQAYINAYLHLDQFADRAKFSTWLTRIAIHEALSRIRKAGRMLPLEERREGVESMADQITSPGQDPEQAAYSQELAREIEDAVAQLPDVFRGVFMLRDVEGLSTLETAECLGLNEDTVKTRLHRARALLRRELTARMGDSAATAFQFHAPRCDRVVQAVCSRLAEIEAAAGSTRWSDPGDRPTPPARAYS
jgi:RNA polymerase sigma-70 factor (ECF subfamily)